MKRALAAIAAAAALAGCATSYEKAASVRQLGPETLLIKAEGNAFTNKSQTDRYALLHAAEQTLEAGYAYFEVIDTYSDYVRVRPEQKDIEVSSYGGLRAQQRIEPSRPTVSNASPSYEPRTEYKIRLHRDYPDLPNVRHFYSAQEIARKYGSRLKFENSASTLKSRSVR